MSIRSLCNALALVLVATSASAGTSTPGINIRWDQCYADGGAWNKQFACDTNSGTERLVLSFELSEPRNDISGLDMSLDIASEGTLPAWWSFKNTGTCRSTSLAMTTTPPAGAVHCPDWGQGLAVGGIGSYLINNLGSGTARIKAIAAVPPGGMPQLLPDVEYFAVAFTINHAKTAGTGSCAGCMTPVCIFFSHAIFTTPVAENDFQLYQGANWLGSQYVTWQNGYPINVVKECESLCSCPSCYHRMYTHMSCVLASPTSNRGSTWAGVKSLYR